MDIFRNARQNFLRRQAEVDGQIDFERLPAQEASGRRPEMHQQQQQQHQPTSARSSPVSAVLRRFGDLSRPSMPSFGAAGRQNQPRPTSSRYDDDGDNNGASRGRSTSNITDEIVSPKTPQFALGMPPLPSTDLHMPDLQRSWTDSSNSAHSARDRGRRSADNTAAAAAAAGIAQPDPVVAAEHMYNMHDHADNGETTVYHDRHGRRRRFDGADPADIHLASMVSDGRWRRHRRRQGSAATEGGAEAAAADNGGRWSRRHRRRQYAAGNGQQPLISSGATGTATTPAAAAQPKTFLFCFPYIKSRRMRSQILKCFVSGSILGLMLTVFLALGMTRNIYSSEFAVLLMLILLFTAIFFAHAVIRLFMLIIHPPTAAEEEAAENRYRRRHGGPFGTMPNLYGPGGYAIPQQPIRVMLARDEEAAGIESVTAKIQPPAYGLWRESVRVDPNRIYWQRNDASAPPVPSVPSSLSRLRSTSASSQGVDRRQDASGDANGASGRHSPRPPSYVSDDGVQYAVEAQPRSIAPTTDVPLPEHPAEAGRTAPPPAW